MVRPCSRPASKRSWHGAPNIEAAGFYETGGKNFPLLQILTAAQILDNRRPQVPFGFTEGFKKAEREETEQGRLI
jgi:site-specific DNA-methyltransferase (adenine-specific)